MPGKYNPFRPDKIVPVGMFCGRIPEIRKIDHCFTQTKSGNPQHFLIEEERGIGKSSLFFIQNYVARGEIETLDDQKVKFVTLSAVLEVGDDYYTVIKKISDALQRELKSKEKLKDFGKKTWEFISRIEAAGLKIRDAESKIDGHQLLPNLLEDFEEIINNLQNYDGILLLIDEADQPGPDGQLGRLCKLLTEHLTFAGSEKLCIGLAGLPGLIATLRESHASSPRLFTTMDLQPLESHECVQVIEAGIKNAEEKGVSVEFTEDAKNFISTVSEGYPHFLQEFSYYAYEIDTDHVIDSEDVSGSLFGENGTFEQLGRKYFSTFYNAPYSDDYRKVLDTMSSHSDEWVDRATIISESRLKDSTVDNALRALRGKNIILKNEQKLGEYRLPTRSFAVWVRARSLAEENATSVEDAPTLFDEAEELS
ncbi:MAG: ATP-binding protein [Alphaproteobacteria bacterium]|jgi:hypothetical protein|nr:ATP-binding protein [Alphaproteobacteria bacterium]